jgi:hypothetical protein
MAMRHTAAVEVAHFLLAMNAALTFAVQPQAGAVKKTGTRHEHDHHTH